MGSTGKVLLFYKYATQGRKGLMSLKHKAIIFDLDGTLVNTGPLISESFRYTIHEVFNSNMGLSELTALVGIPLFEQMQFFSHKYFEERVEKYHDVVSADELTEKLMEIYRSYCAEVHDDYIQEFVGVKDFIETLAERSVPMGVATSKRHEPAVQDLGHFGLYSYFDTLIGADDIDEHKPKPAPLLRVLNILNEKHSLEIQPHECIYVGDSPFDMRASKAAGMMSVGVEYGMFEKSVLENEKPDLLVATPHELHQLLDFLYVY